MNFCTEIIGFTNVTKTKKNIYIKIKMQQKIGEKKSSMIYEHQNINLHFLCSFHDTKKHT